MQGESMRGLKLKPSVCCAGQCNAFPNTNRQLQGVEKLEFNIPDGITYKLWSGVNVTHLEILLIS